MAWNPAVSGNSSPALTRDLIRRLWRNLNPRRRRQAALLLMLMLLGAFSEVISLGAVLPFLSILVAPEAVFRHRVGAELARVLGASTPGELLLPLTLLFVAVAVMTGAIRVLFVWASTRFAYGVGADLSIEVYRRTLYQPYGVHVARNSSAMISGIITKVGGSTNVLLSMLTVASSLVVLAAILVALFSIDPKVAAIAAIGFCSTYGLITLVSRRRLRRNGQRIAHEQTQVIKALQEGLGGIRDVLLDGTQSLYCEVYRRADLPSRRAQGANNFIASSPRFAMEALGMALIAGLAFWVSGEPGGIATALPTLGALALGAQRLLPALQQGYGAWAIIAGYQPMLADTIDLLEQPLPEGWDRPAPAPLPWREAIRFENVRFQYQNGAPWVIDSLTLAIPKGARVGFVGTTGSGKSTTLDLLMGLLTPTNGTITVDGEPLEGSRVRAWQRTIAHVPQNIYLADSTIAENIALGVPRDEIDWDRLRRAARQAQIADFVESSPEEYEAFVGERGVRLSGGQRQRIGIARALYKQATVLVFDEATSALDHSTEQSVMDAVEGLDRELTILLIAHRLSTVRRCDTIVRLENGRLVAEGTYDELRARDPEFWRVAAPDG